MLETNKTFKTELCYSDKLYTLTDEDVKDVQRELLSVFLDLKKVMEENDIPYVLGGGSVLGAIRHKGFIPWDDDIDLNVERQYLVPLKEAIYQRYGDKYYVQLPVECEEHYSTFWDVQKRGTVFRESLAQKEGCCGLKVDIFPIENTYSNGFLRKIHQILSDGASFVLSCIRFHDRKEEYMDLAGENQKAISVIRIKALIGSPLSLSRKFWLRFANQVFSMCKNHDSEYVVVPTGRRHFKGEIYKREAFARGREVEFCNTTAMVPFDTTAYLIRLFGEDYMKVPKKDEQEHHMVYEFKLNGEEKTGEQ